jgi:hypothetical protein
VPYTRAPVYWLGPAVWPPFRPNGYPDWEGSGVPGSGISSVLNGFLFPDVSGMPLLQGDTRYRNLFVANFSAVAITDVRVYFAALPAGGAKFDMGVDPTPAALYAEGPPAAPLAVIPPAPPTSHPPGTPPWVPLPQGDQMAPAGVAFARPTSIGTSLTVGTLAPGFCRSVWVRREVDPLPDPWPGSTLTLCCECEEP